MLIMIGHTLTLSGIVRKKVQYIYLQDIYLESLRLTILPEI